MPALELTLRWQAKESPHRSAAPFRRTDEEVMNARKRVFFAYDSDLLNRDGKLDVGIDNHIIRCYQPHVTIISSFNCKAHGNGAFVVTPPPHINYSVGTFVLQYALLSQIRNVQALAIVGQGAIRGARTAHFAKPP